ncbi:MAG: multifunctional CCA addition/repair protein [Gammaproteobacteria bacterium]|nr:multifunctional CCA addition/repair protein [Gammaproteobacteria bacterium]
MEIYLVGGAVRDNLLDIPIRDKDWVVVGSNARLMKEQGYLQVGKGFPVFLHPDTKQEYALARTERKVGAGYLGFEFDASEFVTLEQDLLRRDLTINAIAESSDGQIIDPYNGRQDIKDKILRHVSPAFAEDPLRVLRVAKFAARFEKLGFTVAPDTLQLMNDIVQSGEIDALVRERVWQEIEQAMGGPAPDVFIRVLRECGALDSILPEVDRLFGVPQPAKYHPEVGTGLHTLLSLQQAAKLTGDPVVRYATLVHDVGKGVTDKAKWPSHHAHETLGLPLQAEISKRLHVPNEFSKLAALVCEHHTKLHRIKELRPTTLLQLIESLDGFRRPERVQKFLLACEADAKGRTGFEERDYPQNAYLTTVLSELSQLDIGALLKEAKPKNTQEFVQQSRLSLLKDILSRLNSSNALN